MPERSSRSIARRNAPRRGPRAGSPAKNPLPAFPTLSEDETLLEVPTQSLVLTDMGLDAQPISSPQKIEDVGFSQPTQRGDRNPPARSPNTSLEPWEDVIDAASHSAEARLKAMTGSLDQPTDEAMLPRFDEANAFEQTPLSPIPDRPPEEITAPQAAPDISWPSGQTKPLQPIAAPMPTPTASTQNSRELLENAPVSREYPPVMPVAPSAPQSDETRLGALLSPLPDPLTQKPKIPEPKETIAAPGELAGLLGNHPKADAKIPNIAAGPTYAATPGALSGLAGDLQEPAGLPQLTPKKRPKITPPPPGMAGALNDPADKQHRPLIDDLPSPPVRKAGAPRVPQRPKNISIPVAGTEPLASDSILSEEPDPLARVEAKPAPPERPKAPAQPPNRASLENPGVLEAPDPAARLRIPPVQTELELDQISFEQAPMLAPRMAETRALEPVPDLFTGLEGDNLSMPGDPVDLGSLGSMPLDPALPRSDTKSVPAPNSVRALADPNTLKLPPNAAEAIEAVEADVGWTLASGPRRFWALVIDGILVSGIVGAPMLLGVFGEPVATASYIDPDDISRLLMQGELTLPLICFFLLILLFSALSHAFVGRSLGKLILGLELVHKKTGERPTKGRAVARALLSIFGILFAGVGYLWLLLNRKAQTLHDVLTGTMVVRSSSKEQRSHGKPVEQQTGFANEPTL